MRISCDGGGDRHRDRAVGGDRVRTQRDGRREDVRDDLGGGVPGTDVHLNRGASSTGSRHGHPARGIGGQLRLGRSTCFGRLGASDRRDSQRRGRPGVDDDAREAPDPVPRRVVFPVVHPVVGVDGVRCGGPGEEAVARRLLTRLEFHGAARRTAVAVGADFEPDVGVDAGNDGIRECDGDADPPECGCLDVRGDHILVDDRDVVHRGARRRVQTYSRARPGADARAGHSRLVGACGTAPLNRDVADRGRSRELDRVAAGIDAPDLVVAGCLVERQRAVGIVCAVGPAVVVPPQRGVGEVVGGRHAARHRDVSADRVAFRVCGDGRS